MQSVKMILKVCVILEGLLYMAKASSVAWGSFELGIQEWTK